MKLCLFKYKLHIANVGILLLLLIAETVNATEYTVTPDAATGCTPAFECDLQSALADAASNNLDDTITIGVGQYTANVPFEFLPQDGNGIIIDGEVIYDLNNNKISARITGNASQLMTIPAAAGAASFIFINDLVFENGDSATNGGGLHINVNDSQIQLTNNEFRFNKSALDGGGLYIVTTTGSITLNANQFIDNGAVTFGGGAYVESGIGPIKLTNNAFWANRVSIDPVPDVVEPMPLINSRGGGFYIKVNNTQIVITNNTVWSNVSSLGGSGFHLELFDDNANVDIYNNIVWTNTTVFENISVDFRVDADADNNQTGSAVKYYNNNLSVADINPNAANVESDNNISNDPRLNVDFSLQSGSMCIDAGELEAPGLPAFDLFGDSRVVNNLPDIGVHEFRSNSRDSGSCFIATAAYGSYLSEEVVLLRGFRDNYLLTNSIGRILVENYYNYSPPMAEIISRHEILRMFTRWVLSPIVYFVKYPITAMTLFILLFGFGIVGITRHYRSKKRLV